MQAVSDWVDRIERAILALLLATMTIVTFSQVIARYVFNSGWVPALELTTICFAWLVLFGCSYGLKIGGHLGVDALIRLAPKPVFRLFVLFGVACCVIYAVIFFYGSCGNPFVTGKLCGSGYVGKMAKIGLRSEDLHWPRWMIYSILPIGMTLFAFRAVEAGWAIMTGQRESLAAGHEAEDLVRENEGVVKS
ncbi:TRAP transporter small permease [Thalassobaculum sp.]|uniref:TRAP transporter small permease n=1 Tax=Thalassobaculum sp. TaxID=2022740 RepID=UPI0032EB5F32